ncbi:MAG: class I adenylate-forming enzyme family protein [Steroidobacteraceae bacterium]
MKPDTRPEVRLSSLLYGPPLSEEPGLGALTLPGYLREITSRFARREALMMRAAGGVERWSYSDLWERSMEFARALIAIGLGKDGRVGILMTNRPELVSSVFGTALAGGVAVMFNTFSTAVELDYMLQASSVSVLLFEGKVLKKDFAAMLGGLEPGIADGEPGQLKSTRFPFLRHLAAVGATPAGGAVECWADFLARGAVTPPALVSATADSVRPPDTAALFFSSGSTARPKGVLSAQRGIAIQLWRMGRLFDLSGDVRAWTPNGLFWSGNFATVMGTTFSAGGTLVLQSTFIAHEALDLMEAERVNFPMLWPHQAKQLEEASNWKRVDLSAMRFLDPSSPLARHPTVTLTSWKEPRHSYGSTETFTLSTCFPPGTPPSITGDTHGIPLPGNTLKIVDPVSGETLPRGEHGEIAVKGPTLMLGYLRVPVEEAFDEEGFYRTGDGGYVDDVGRLYFEGRLTTVIKTGGANVSPMEIDTVLESFPGVKAARVVGVPHETLGEMVVACVVPVEGATLDGAAIQNFARERLASYKVPRRVLFLRDADLSLTGSAKIKPAELRKLATELLQAQPSEGVNAIAELRAR